MRKKVLWVGDAACPSGFGLATKMILEGLDYRIDGDYDVTVLGVNYRGDPHDFPYPIYAAAPGGDGFGVGRLIWMCDRMNVPDVIIIQNDGWNFAPYLKELRRVKEYANIPVIAVVAVDGKNFRGEWLNGIAHSVFWTEFALDEARKGGYQGPASVIPLGVDPSVFYPVDRKEARHRRFGEHIPDDVFIVGNINRNQPRKRWDLTIRYFANWVKYFDPKSAYLFLHTAPTGEQGVEVQQLAQYYGILDQIILREPPMFYGVPEDELRDTYNLDVQVSTTQGEGFGLTTFEGMACGIPQIVPDWSALGELALGAARLVPCSMTAVGPPYLNVLGGVADEEVFLAHLDQLYRHPEQREEQRQKGFTRVREERFSWPHIGKQYLELVGQVLAPKVEVPA